MSRNDKPAQDVACERCWFWSSGGYTCRRFPAAVPKEARDWCGEWKDGRCGKD